MILTVPLPYIFSVLVMSLDGTPLLLFVLLVLRVSRVCARCVITFLSPTLHLPLTLPE